VVNKGNNIINCLALSPCLIALPMEATYHDVAHLWDFSHPSNFSQLPEDDFLALLHKQYPPPSASSSAISNHLVSPGPPSEDSSPSPPNSHNDPDDPHDSAPKRKASDGGLEDGGPNQKAQHTRESLRSCFSHQPRLNLSISRRNQEAIQSNSFHGFKAKVCRIRVYCMCLPFCCAYLMIRGTKTPSSSLPRTRVAS
jgi:hypothetical protein